MKSLKNARNLVLGMFAIALTISFTSCESEPAELETQQQITPDRFTVAIPSSLSGSPTFKSSTLKSAKADTLNGNEIYESLKLFIAVGKGAADITESIIYHIKSYKIERVTELVYQSNEDDRSKRLVVKKDVSFEDRTWQYQLTITDMASESAEDGGIGMQIFWNNSPIEGIALIKPVNTNRKEIDENREAMFRIDYSEKATEKYDSHMIVQISNLPTNRIGDDRFAISSMKMFVGKKGNVVDVYGNSNHPNAAFFTDETGFNWAFVASSQVDADIAVAEVALPPSTLNSDSRQVILKEYSIKSVFTSQINIWFYNHFKITPSEASIANYLVNAEAPGYFNKQGFIKGGTAPNNSYTAIEARLNTLTPFNPKSISELKLDFLK